MRTITIDRKKWVRGNLNGESALLNDDGCRCCLGFAVCQITKLPLIAIQGMGDPEQVFAGQSFLTELNEDGCVVNNHLTNRAIKINDDVLISERVREYRLARLFKGYDIKIVFKN